MQQRETAAIPKLVLSTGTQLLRRITIDRPRLTIGRRPFNDVMLDDLTVSGEHAMVHCESGRCTVHDLRSRNGTLVNGVPVTQRTLAEGDRIDIGIYSLHYVVDRVALEPAPASHDTAEAHLSALSGPQAGGAIALDRPIVSLSNGTGQVAVLARRRTGWVITHLEGPSVPLVNGEPIGLTSHALKPDDLVELAGAIFQFVSGPPPP
ncbi:MAG: hypothetical protein RJA99_3467 [Pseudomonadota bacterium]|jgi:hypothetical protein